MDRPAPVPGLSADLLPLLRVLRDYGQDRLASAIAALGDLPYRAYCAGAFDLQHALLRELAADERAGIPVNRQRFLAAIERAEKVCATNSQKWR